MNTLELPGLKLEFNPDSGLLFFISPIGAVIHWLNNPDEIKRAGEFLLTCQRDLEAQSIPFGGDTPESPDDDAHLEAIYGFGDRELERHYAKHELPFDGSVPESADIVIERAITALDEKFTYADEIPFLGEPSVKDLLSHEFCPSCGSADIYMDTCFACGQKNISQIPCDNGPSFQSAPTDDRIEVDEEWLSAALGSDYDRDDNISPAAIGLQPPL